VLRHPSRRYIYYLFSKRTMDVATIIAHLEELRLPAPPDAETAEKFRDELLAERRRMRFPVQYDPFVLNPETRAFLREWKIEGIWAKDDFVLHALDLLFEASIRRMIETMLLGPLAIPDIARRVRERFGLPERAMNTAVVRAYGHYFWDDSALTLDEWRWFAFHWTRGRCNDYITALSAPRTPAGAAMAISVADRGGGQSLSPVVMYSAMRDHGFNMFMQHALNDSPGLARTQAAMFALEIVTKSQEELDKRRGASAELLEELNKIETIYDSRKMTTVHELPQLRRGLPPPAVIDTHGEDVTDPEKEPTT